MQTRRASLQTSAVTAVNAAHAFPDSRDLGTLGAGSPPDLTVLEMRNSEFEYVDNAGTRRKGRPKLFVQSSAVSGKVFRRPS